MRTPITRSSNGSLLCTNQLHLLVHCNDEQRMFSISALSQHLAQPIQSLIESRFHFERSHEYLQWPLIPILALLVLSRCQSSFWFIFLAHSSSTFSLISVEVFSF